MHTWGKFVVRTISVTTIVGGIVPDIARTTEYAVIVKINVTWKTASAGVISTTIKARTATSLARCAFVRVSLCWAFYHALIIVKVCSDTVSAIRRVYTSWTVGRALGADIVCIRVVKNGTLS